MIRLERPRLRHADIRRLLLGQLGQLDAEFVEVKRGNLFVEVLGQDVNLVLVLLGTGEQFDLRERLVGEAS